MERLRAKAFLDRLSRIGHPIFCFAVSKEEFEAESLPAIVFRLKVRGRVARDASLVKTKRVKGGGRILFFEVPCGVAKPLGTARTEGPVFQRPPAGRGKAVEEARKVLRLPDGRGGSPATRCE